MGDLPFMPVPVAEFLADTAQMTDAQLALYTRMYLHLWRAPRQRLPNDRTWIARNFKTTQATIEDVLQRFVSDGNWITHRIVTQQHERAARQSTAQSARAKARWAQQRAAETALGDSQNDTAPGKPLQSAANGVSPRNTRPALPSYKERDSSLESEIQESPPPPNGGGTPHGADGLFGDQPGKGPRRRTQMRKGWLPLLPDRRFAISCGIAAEDVDDVVEAFADHWIGIGEPRSDWNATFRTWCRREVSYDGRRARRPQGRARARPGDGTAVEGAYAVAAQLREDYLAAGPHGPEAPLEHDGGDDDVPPGRGGAA